jgi:hypothetical protein
MEIERKVLFSIQEIEKIISIKSGIELKLQKFNYKSYGDYDSGTFKEILTELIFTNKIPTVN